MSASIPTSLPSKKEGEGVKPSLKNPTTQTAASDDGTDTKQQGNPKDDRHLKWDEEVIEEHNLLRGTRMKIDEPNTPYIYDSGAESDESSRKLSPHSTKPTISIEALGRKLDTVAAVQDNLPSESSTDADELTESQRDGKKSTLRRLEFSEHRKRHYNEMELVRKFRAENAEDEDDAE